MDIIYNPNNMTDKRTKKEEQQQRQRMEREMKMLQDQKNKLMPLVKFLKKHGLPFKYARVGDKRVEFFRFDEYEKFLTLCQDKLKTNPHINELVQSCPSESTFVYFKRPADSKPLKYPHELQITYPSDPEGKFCSFKFDTTISKSGLMFSLILGVLALVLFPVWPYAVKYAIWLISLYLLIFLVGLLGLRLVIYCFCVVAGFNVWLFPNLLGDQGFFDSFKPIFYAERWQKNKLNIVIRIAVFLLIVLYGVHLYMDAQFRESHLRVTKSTIDDIHDWGVSKITNDVKFSERAITSVQDILNKTADVEEQSTANTNNDESSHTNQHYDQDYNQDIKSEDNL